MIFFVPSLPINEITIMQKILVANRGEIALRVMRTAKRMGIKTVAVYSDADKYSAHVQFADEAVHIGPAASSESYLQGAKIIQVAKELGVDGIHPGYGFLSENAAFSKLVREAGITFIGPREEAITVMGSKLAAKDAVKNFDIPMVPGTEHAIDDINEAIAVAQEIGFPILIKASAGGGGKGMRAVYEEKDLEEQMQLAISEATSAFGDGSVFIERYVTEPRHIEIQVLADQHGKVLHLFERECSIQRRHQKVVEEAPSAVLTPELREEMGQAAIRVAQACNYEGAGTVEFLLDAQNRFYFLEMNTRLQVEHPVTECITGLDLVEQQIKIARGEHLAFEQEDLAIKGHAIELRVYAEDPLNNFLPSIGTLNNYSEPSGEGIRVDSGYEDGHEIPIYYDPMIAKLIVYADTRKGAIELLKTAINNYNIEGIATTLPFGLFVANHDAFISGQFDTGFVGKYYSNEIFFDSLKEENEVGAKFALFMYNKDNQQLKVAKRKDWRWLEARK